MLAAARIERSFPYVAAKAAEYGFAVPAGEVRFAYREGGPPAQRYRIGALTPDGFGRYLLDPVAARVVTIPAYQLDNLERLVERAP
ncbi:MAG: hypothetical protein KDK06_05955 [Gammaproteobacteria bacterium]|nr:hypothetical protein [Gammaproteobacteria bacterium]